MLIQIAILSKRRRLASIENNDKYAELADFVENKTDTQLDLRDFP